MKAHNSNAVITIVLDRPRAEVTRHHPNLEMQRSMFSGTRFGKREWTHEDTGPLQSTHTFAFLING